MEKLTMDHITSLIDSENYVIEEQYVQCILMVGEAHVIGTSYRFSKATHNHEMAKKAARDNAISELFCSEAYHQKRIRKVGMGNAYAESSDPNATTVDIKIGNPFEGMAKRDVTLMYAGVDCQATLKEYAEREVKTTDENRELTKVFKAHLENYSKDSYPPIILPKDPNLSVNTAYSAMVENSEAQRLVESENRNIPTGEIIHKLNEFELTDEIKKKVSYEMCIHYNNYMHLSEKDKANTMADADVFMLGQEELKGLFLENTDIIYPVFNSNHLAALKHYIDKPDLLMIMQMEIDTDGASIDVNTYLEPLGYSYLISGVMINDNVKRKDVHIHDSKCPNW